MDRVHVVGLLDVSVIFLVIFLYLFRIGCYRGGGGGGVYRSVVGWGSPSQVFMVVSGGLPA